MKKGYKRNIPVILQMEALECGAASLAMVLGAYGRHLPLERLRSDCGVSRDGSNAKNLAIAARHHGMEVKAYRYSAAQLRQQEKGKFPMIIHWDFNHFVVLCAFRKKTAVLHDPAVGRVEVPWEQFEKSYTGVCLTFSPGESFTPCGKEKNALDFVRERLKGYGASSMLLIGAGLFLILLGMAAPVSTKLFTDYVLLEGSGEWMRNLAVLMLTVLFLTFGMNLFQIGLLYRIRGKMTVELSVEFLWHTLILPMEFYGQRTAGDIASRQADTDQVAGILFERVIPAVTNGVMAMLYFGVLWYYDVKMAWIALAAAAANFLAVKAAAKKNSSDNRMLTRDEAKLAGSAMAAVSMIETVKASGAEEGIFSKLSGYQARYDNTKYAIRNRNAWLSNLPILFTDVSSAVILALGVEKIMGGSFTIGVMVAFQGFFLSFLNPVNALLAVSEDLYRLRGKLERIEDVRAYPPDAGAGRWQHDGDQRLSGRIQLSHVSFGYQPLAAPLIPDFSLDIQPGEMTALAGGSGSGKSTIANLITGLYQVRDGKILFDGKTRTEIDRYVFVNSLSIVDQNIVIFQDTIRNNLTLWDASIPESRLIEACKDACIYDEITKYAEGFDYQLCEGGGNLSGGQRQRIEIARALVSEPSILILDEATSALDPLTEKRVMDAVKRRGITCLVIAHRLSAIRDADQIILLEHGSEVERGTHESLLQKEGGRYQALIKSEG